MKSKKPKKPVKKLNLPNDEPVKLDMSFEEAIKRAATTPLKNSKIYKKKATIKDVFLYNGDPYDKATLEGKKEIYFWVGKIEKTKEAKQILKHYSKGKINIKTHGRLAGDQQVIPEGIPDDLVIKICNLVYPM